MTWRRHITPATAQAAMRQARRVVEQVGWAQGYPQTLDGRVDLERALTIAVDGDQALLVHAHAVVEQHLPLYDDLSTWNDRPERTVDDVLELLDRAAATAAP